jgi:hypothetical protein
MVEGLPRIDHVDQICDSCLVGKQRCFSFPSEVRYRAHFKLELLHGDLCGPVTPATPSSNKYFFLLIDDLSRHMWVTFLRTMDQAKVAFVAFQARAEAGRRLGILCTDHGGEFTTCVFLDHYIKEGIQHHLTAPFSPEHNGVVERRNQTILGMARSMLKAMKMPGGSGGKQW